MKDKVFILNSYCIPTLGYSRSLIVDLHHNRAKILPEIIFRYLNLNKSNQELKTEYNLDEGIDYFFDLLEKEDYGFYVDYEDKNKFPQLSMKWESPFALTNSIIEIENFDYVLISNVINEIAILNCKNINFRLFNKTDVNQIFLIIEMLNKQNIDCVEFTFFYEPNYSEIKEIEKFNKYSYKVFNLNDIVSCDVIDCKKINQSISSKDFIINTPFFTESQNLNNCLNKKICIDIAGNIKNCPSSKKVYGNIKDVKLSEVLEKSEFKEVWTITKKQIDVCKDCENCYICLDCRMFIKDSDNIYSQPLKCKYNPYIAKWQNEDGFVSVEECGTYSKENGFVPDIQRINDLNKLIWGD